ncbi:TRAP transporter large permease subunit, partial [Streptomyces scabiei]
MSHAPMTSAAQWSLSVLPMFVLMGLLLGASGVTSRLYRTARNWLNWLPGGLGVGTNLAGAGLASVSGSTIGTTYALARVS